MRLVIADISDFQGHRVGQFLLDGEVPLMHHGVAEVHCQTAEADRRRPGKDVDGVAARQATGKIRVGIEHGRSRAGSRALEVRRLVEWCRFSAVRVAALLFFTAVEDAVTQPDDGLRPPTVSGADARAEVRLIPWNQIFVNLPDGNMDVGEVAGEARRQRRILVLALRDVQGHGLEIEVRLAAERLGAWGGYRR